jgi:hypothetical protein
VNYALELGKRYLRDEYFDEFSNFFEKTHSHALVIRLIIKEIIADRDWELGALLRDDMLDYLLFELDDVPLNIKNMRSCIWALRRKNYDAIANRLWGLFIDFTEGTILTTDTLEHSEYLKAEEQKKINDLRYIQSSSEFRTGLLNYFNAYGKEVLDDEDLFIDFSDNNARRGYDSNFLYRFLLTWVSEGRKVSLNKALKIVDNSDSFEYIRATLILDYHFEDPKKNALLIEIVREYFLKNLNHDIANSAVDTKEGYRYSRKNRLIGRIFSKYAFQIEPSDLMQLVWLDEGGIHNFDHIRNDRKSISELILEQLSAEQLIVFKQKIVANINLGIKSSVILGSHLALCKRLKIFESREVILNLILKGKILNLRPYEVIDIYLELKGEINNFLPYFRKLSDFSDHTYLYLATRLAQNHKTFIENSLIAALNNSTLSTETRLTFANELVKIGNREGFTYIFNKMLEDKKFPDLYHRKFEITNLETDFILEKIKPTIHFLIYPEYSDQSFHESPKEMMLNWLYSLSSRNEVDLIKVLNFLNEARLQLGNKYERADDLYWYMNGITEKFRDSESNSKGIEDIKRILELV